MAEHGERAAEAEVTRDQPVRPPRHDLHAHDAVDPAIVPERGTLRR
jgi:hypothetical protein